MQFIKACVFGLASLTAAGALAQDAVQLIDDNGQSPQLSELDRLYIATRLEQLDLAQCQTRLLNKQPRVVYRQLTLQHNGQNLHINVADDVMRTRNLVIYTESGKEWREYYACPQDPLLPALAIIATAKVSGQEIGSNDIRQKVLARHTQLSSHEPTELMIRTDSNNPSHPYLDFTLSLKHPLFANWEMLEQLQAKGADVMEALIPGDQEYLVQPYLAFTGRFSQYIGTRQSSPVMERRFNPSLFYRIWSSDDAWFDAGLAHESNGQRINTQEALAREQLDYVARGEDAQFARDALSRGWDYSFIDWQRSWNSQWQTHLQLRHYLSDGPLQGKSEEYNLWEDGGRQARPRSAYDGVSISLQYNFNRSRCFVGTAFVCFNKLDVKQETGYSGLFKHKTTTVEFTTDFFGLPVQLWSRNGYASDLVDYYRYTKSWGLGIELRTP